MTWFPCYFPALSVYSLPEWEPSLILCCHCITTHSMWSNTCLSVSVWTVCSAPKLLLFALLQVSSLLWWSHTGPRRCCHSRMRGKAGTFMRVSAPPLLHATQPLHWVCSANRDPSVQRCAHQLSGEAMFASFCRLQKSMLSICSGSLQSGHGPVYIKSLPITASRRGSELTAKVCPKEQKMKSGAGGGANVKLIFLRFLALCRFGFGPLPCTAKHWFNLPEVAAGWVSQEGRRSQVAGVSLSIYQPRLENLGSRQRLLFSWGSSGACLSCDLSQFCCHCNV